MATAKVRSGICGFSATVDTRMEGSRCVVSMESDCSSVQRLAEELTEVEPLEQP